MLRKESEVVPEGNDPVHQQDEFGSGQPMHAGGSISEVRRNMGQEDRCYNETFGTAFNKPGAWCSAATSCNDDRRARKHEDSQADEGRHYCSSSDAWG